MSSEANNTDLDGFGGGFSDRKYETFKMPKGGGAGSLLWRPVAHPKFGTKQVGFYWKTHFGWKGVDQNDPNKTVFRPFTCLEQKGDAGMTAQECPACKLRQSKQDEIEKIKNIGKAKGKSDAEIKKAIAPRLQWLKDHGLDGKVRIPGYDKKGQIGIFLCPYGMFKSFRDAAREMEQKGFQPAGRKGLYFEFIRSKQASFDSDKCQVSRVAVDNDGTTKLDISELTPELAKQLLENIPDLTQLRDRDTYSLEKIEALCAMTKGADGAYDPKEVDHILGIEAKSRGASRGQAAGDDSWASEAEGKKEESKSAEGAAAEGAAAEDDAFAGGTEPAKAPPKEEQKKEPPKSKEPPKQETPPAQEEAELSDGEFDNVFGD